ncbi:uncharacterized protein K444DRAFT_430944 [Hyaloscypha bicolor E]|uniref:Zn(2)-C6 fungal-type domain-containing protein n=1 Tax=Hyaloscypha bicolor E TaxID=1095630 RepID=A0A2J6T5P6_9HELO|nr:uncharacterized protein K444DRAFT_430944 [Hyaloscypha bicolor E]PMD58344.1 hypothetical protein K444DRAFT_430944 [Hyaloscypha bicolor E]
MPPFSYDQPAPEGDESSYDIPPVSRSIMQPPSDLKKRTAGKAGCNTCRKRRVKCDETKPSCVRCRKFGRVCSYWQFSEDPLPAPPADVFGDDGDDNEEQPEAAARRDNFPLEDIDNPLALGASAGLQISGPARLRAMSDGGPPERPSPQKPPLRGLGYPSSESVNILDQEKVSTPERISPPERGITGGGAAVRLAYSSASVMIFEKHTRMAAKGLLVTYQI